MPARKSPGKSASRPAKAAPKTARKGAKKAPRKAPRPAGGSAVAKRDAPVPAEDSGADMDEAPMPEAHGDLRRDSTGKPGKPRAGRAAAARQTMRREREAEHMHQDPRWEAPKVEDKWLRAKRDPRKEGGLSKDRQVRRFDGITNWFRQAPKPKG